MCHYFWDTLYLLYKYIYTYICEFICTLCVRYYFTSLQSNDCWGINLHSVLCIFNKILYKIITKDHLSTVLVVPQCEARSAVLSEIILLVHPTMFTPPSAIVIKWMPKNFQFNTLLNRIITIYICLYVCTYNLKDEWMVVWTFDGSIKIFTTF